MDAAVYNLGMAQRIRADRDMLEAALVGLEHRREEIEGKLAELRELIAKMGGGNAGRAAGRPGRRSRVLSAAARSRIAAAQKKRWEAFRKSKAQPKAKAAKRGKKSAKARGRKASSQATPPPAAASAANE
jgi:hypothetical protein